ncbi:MAG TPA: hypothetical protein VK804_02750 [Bradyrhizobium sp.]|jgi:hypothetical protein|uniref:hypothetical protein n=1 Tax=Bradyrhizobium sp. TaxID=376 RepID=UPI002CB54945|nr:hypothetical protein [Bradyrhizobium sp.]HTA99369.1 hypothetical protein [Bradyrhizobium sp.]
MNRAQRLRALEREASFAVPDDIAIAEANVLRRLDIGGRVFKRGDVLSSAQLLAIPSANLRAMVVNRYLELQRGAVE